MIFKENKSPLFGVTKKNTININHSLCELMIFKENK